MHLTKQTRWCGFSYRLTWVFFGAYLTYTSSENHCIIYTVFSSHLWKYWKNKDNESFHNFINIFNNDESQDYSSVVKRLPGTHESILSTTKEKQQKSSKSWLQSLCVREENSPSLSAVSNFYEFAWSTRFVAWQFSCLGMPPVTCSSRKGISFLNYITVLMTKTSIYN